MNKIIFLLITLASALVSQNNCQKILDLAQSTEYSYIRSLCSNYTQKNAELFISLYLDSKSVSKENITLLNDNNIHRHKTSLFTIYTSQKYINDWLALFSGKLSKNDYQKIFHKLKDDVRDELYKSALQGKKIVQTYTQDSKCISGNMIEGNLIVPLNKNEFITIEEQEEVTLRWYYDNNNCSLIQKFLPTTITKKQLQDYNVVESAN